MSQTSFADLLKSYLLNAQIHRMLVVDKVGFGARNPPRQWSIRSNSRASSFHLCPQSEAPMTNQLRSPLGTTNYFQQIAEKSFNAVIIFDEQARIQFWNEAATRLFGWSEEEAIGHDIHELFTPCHLVDEERRKFASYQATGHLADAGHVFEALRVRKEGSEVWVELSFGEIDVDGAKWAFAIVRDADARKRREIELRQQAATDGLTGLANRREFQRLLEESLDRRLTLAIIDIDQFKGLNDTFGHPIGDDVIQHVAEQLQTHFDSPICVSRLGGDEFGIILPTPSGPNFGTAELEKKFNALRASIAETPIADLDPVTASIGIAVSTQPSVSARLLLTTADKMLYEAKSSGRDRVALCKI